VVGDVAETIDPVVADGVVDGLHQVVRLKSRDGRTVILDLVMTWGAADPHDEVVIDGEPPIRLRIDGGYHGDAGTTASVTRALALIPHLEPGFYRPTDLPLRPSK
jgi:4-hydroxy-tetrahydrodipicolinate reductase